MDLYHPRILELSKTPLNFEKAEKASREVLSYNPLCGDEYTVYLSLTAEERLIVSFHGYGCAVSKASASMLMAEVRGLEISAAVKKIDHFLECFENEKATGNADLDVLLAARNFPSRITCACQVWQESLKQLRSWADL